jgi:hypothetical protein
MTKEWTLKNTAAISRSYEGKYCELSCTTALTTLDIFNWWYHDRVWHSREVSYGLLRNV